MKNNNRNNKKTNEYFNGAYKFYPLLLVIMVVLILSFLFKKPTQVKDIPDISKQEEAIKDVPTGDIDIVVDKNKDKDKEIDNEKENTTEKDKNKDDSNKDDSTVNKNNNKDDKKNNKPDKKDEKEISAERLVRKELEFYQTLNDDVYIKYQDPCDVNSVTEPISVYNVAIDQKYDYYSRTDEKNRVISSYAKELFLKDRGAGQYCNQRFPSNSNEFAKNSKSFITGGNDDRGHMIGDQFDGNSSASNINSQHSVTNRQTFVSIENYLAKTLKNGGSVENFLVVALFNDNELRPYKYLVSVDVNGDNETYTFLNDGTSYIRGLITDKDDKLNQVLNSKPSSDNKPQNNSKPKAQNQSSAKKTKNKNNKTVVAPIPPKKEPIKEKVVNKPSSNKSNNYNVSDIIVNKGDNATISFNLKPNTRYSITIMSPSNNKLTAQGLEPKTSDANGNISWTFKVGSRTKEGVGSFTINSNDDSFSGDYIVN